MRNEAMISTGRSGWQFYHAPGTASAVEVFLSMPQQETTDTHAWQLIGPFCHRTRMLPATFHFQPVDGRLWKTTVTDPCFWTPGLPALYRLQSTNMSRHELTVAPEVGLRRIEARTANLYLDGRRWVFRGSVAPPDELSEDAMRQAHSLGLGLVVDPLTPALHLAAAREGIPLIVNIANDGWQERMEMVSRCPAVQLVTLPRDWSGTRAELRSIAPNLLVAVALVGEESFAVPDWADAVICDDVRPMLRSASDQQPPRPVLAIGSAEGSVRWSVPMAFAQIRALCEGMQRGLAPEFDLSGYIVGGSATF